MRATNASSGDVGAGALLLLHGGADAEDHAAEVMVGVEEHGLTLHSSDHGLIIALVDLAQQRDHSGAEAEALHSLVVVAGFAEPVPQEPGMTQILLCEILIGKIVILLDALESKQNRSP